MSPLAGFASLSRRRLLGLSLAAGGLSLVGGGGGLWLLRGKAAAVGGLRFLSAHEYRTFAALAEAVLPEGGAFPVGAGALDLARAFDDYAADEPEWIRQDFQRSLLLLEYGPVLFERRLVTFSNLSAAERLAHFEGWGTSGMVLRRQVATAFRRFMMLIFYDKPKVWPHLGYEGPLVRGEEPR